MSIGLRPTSPSDAVALSTLLADERGHLAPWEPVRPVEWFTEAGQRARREQAESDRAEDRSYAFLIVDHGTPIGQLTLASVVRGAGQFCSLGFWVAEKRTGCGVASVAVEPGVQFAFDNIGLHRVQAETLVHNIASRRVLAKTGFEEIGLAPEFLMIAGTWQDHVLHQRLNPHWA
ncbi:GNAT family N-acetyltransferase [Micrococcus lylae]|uniref:GNAT family N-acetyltransferase n=1 Tax=Micrococcus lylae TaxID=1273 RepID=UPI003EBF2C8C